MYGILLKNRLMFICKLQAKRCTELECNLIVHIHLLVLFQLLKGLSEENFEERLLQIKELVYPGKQ